MAKARAIADEYARAVLAGEVVAGRLIHQACQRWRDDWENRERKGFKWSDERADHVLEFCEKARHFEGEWAKGADKDGEPCSHGDDCHECTYPQRFTPEPWQVFTLANLFGWTVERRGRWVRRFTKFLLLVARKNGKTFFLALIGLYLFRMDGERGAQVFSAATKKDQAKIVWGAAAQILKRTPEYADLGISVYGSDKPRSTPTMVHEEAASKFLPIGQDYDTEDGLNPHGALIDEYHAHKDNGVVEVLETGMGARLEPMLGIITTAGESTDTPCGRERDYAIKILGGVQGHESYFALIYEPDLADEEEGREEDDPGAEDTWRKANPNYGVSVYAETLRDAYNRAKDDPRKLAEFFRKRLNLWRMDPGIGWIPIEVWDRSKAQAAPVEARPCWGGIDLASVKDTTSTARIYPPAEGSDVWALRGQVYIPAARVVELEKYHRAPWRAWAADGWVTLTEGNNGEIADYGAVEADVLQCDTLQEVGFDPWNATQLAGDLQAAGVRMVLVRQGFATLSPAMKELERLIRARLLDHGGNPVARMMLANMAVRSDDNDNIAPSKRKSRGPIDLLAAAVIALSRAMAAGLKPQRSIYADYPEPESYQSA